MQREQVKQNWKDLAELEQLEAIRRVYFSGIDIKLFDSTGKGCRLIDINLPAEVIKEINHDTQLLILGFIDTQIEGYKENMNLED